MSFMMKHSLAPWGAIAIGVWVAVGAGCDDQVKPRVILPGQRLDQLQQVDVGKVDILWIVDDSGSMADKQKNLADNFAEFFKVIDDAKVDYHIGVLTTDTVKDAAKLQGSPAVITPTTPNPVNTFAANIKVGTGGSALEKGLDAARLFFQTPDPAFLRQDAFLFMIFVSDEDDKSLPGEPHYFYRLYEGLKGKGNDKMVTVSAIVGDVPDGCFNSVGMWKASAGVRYKAVIDATGGRLTSICDGSFGASLRQLGIDLVGLQRHFSLSIRPDPSTIVVKTTYPCDADTTRLNNACSAQDKKCDGDNGAITCTVKAAPDDGTTTGWVYQSKPSENIFFQGDSVPPKGSHIEFSYFEFGKAPQQ